MKKSVATFASAKASGEKLTLLTAYDYLFARMADESGVDAILVGDSLGSVLLGYPDTLSVTVEEMLHHTKAVSRAAKSAMVVGDLPFMSYHISDAQAVETAGRFVKEGGAQAVKLEGGSLIASRIRAIVDASIPVMGHIGITPQSLNATGGLSVAGGDAAATIKLLEDSKALEEAGAFAVVLECIPDIISEKITKSLSIPTMGLGSGLACSGQVMLYHTMLGLHQGPKPKFAKCYLAAGELIAKSFSDFVSDVKNKRFPEPQHCFQSPGEALDKLY